MQATSELQIGHYLLRSDCEGPGTRFALWVAGCSLRCPGCCNPELFDAEAGRTVGLHELVAAVRGVAADIEGVSVLGGEPFEQADGVLAFCETLRRELPQLGIVVFSGFEAHELDARGLLGRIGGWVDTVVAGRFDARRLESPVDGRRYLGSENQRLLHFTSRYADPASWRGPVSAEVQVDAQGRLTVHGAPALTRMLRRRLQLDDSTTALV